MHDAFDYGLVVGQRVAIVGHGAFAVENIRTCCEYSAKKVYLICRRKNLACPRVASWFVNQSGNTAVPAWLFLQSVAPMYDLIGYDQWGYHSVHSNEKRTNVTITQKARFGIGDVYFLAVYMGKCEVLVDTIKRLTARTVHLGSGQKLEVDAMLKLFGFDGEFENDRLLRIKEMHSFWVNADNRRYIVAEPISVNAQNFGGTSLSPGALVWVDHVTHFLDFPRDWVALRDSGMLPKHKAEPDNNRPAYVLDARLASGASILIPAFAPQVAERSATQGMLKRTRQLQCHPMKTYIDQAAAEWDEYARKWKEEDPSLKDPPPYPYTYVNTTGFLRDLKELESGQGERAA